MKKQCWKRVSAWELKEVMQNTVVMPALHPNTGAGPRLRRAISAAEAWVPPTQIIEPADRKRDQHGILYVWIFDSIYWLKSHSLGHDPVFPWFKTNYCQVSLYWFPACYHNINEFSMNTNGSKKNFFSRRNMWL